ncbi:hypothetical protein HHI36_020342 [Cryptolaemus montrouzieri]|uniref:Major facilitator superfamily (MFS) profile domain-containing protein n=1 Tax=Cryptolaemus montrouzieri TaxID=559131 RepID=A0ABD2NAD2_9CUCU
MENGKRVLIAPTKYGSLFCEMGTGKEASSNNLVIDENRMQGNKAPQYIAALSVCLGSVAAGTVLGWTSNIDLTKGILNNLEITMNQVSWIGSMATLGGLLVCVPIGYYCDIVGRKLAMLSMIILFSLGWLLIIFANSVTMIYLGRLITGMAGGAFCIAAPMYTSEIAEKEIRGTLGSYFQLLLTVGILISNVLGAYVDIKTFSILCFCIPLVFGAVFFFQPETPIYSLKKGKEDDARKALRRLRGPDYDVDSELKELKQQIESAEQNQISLKESLKKKATKKAFVISFGLMMFQQLSGINAVIFFTSTIFKQAGANFSFSPTIIVGIMQVIATFVSSIVVDKFGRKILLIGSDSMMALSSVALGIYFTLQDRHILNEDQISTISFLPVLSLCVFIIVFSLGFGPIPWMISSEVFPPEIKSVASSAAGTFNWFLAFIVTAYYQPLTSLVGADVTFYMFTLISFTGSLFVFFVVPETKGKTMNEIQNELNGEQINSNGVENKAYS